MSGRTGRGGAATGGSNGDRQAARTLWQLAVAGGVFVAGLVVLVVSTQGDGGELPAGVGPPPGAEVDEYAAARHERLDELEGRVRAVVSLTRYLDESAVEEVVGGGIERWLVAAPGGSPRVTDDPAAWRDEFATAARAEAAELEDLLPTVEDEEFAAQYRADLDRALEIAEALEAGDPVVFGVVITGEAGDLRRLLDEPAVRLVDPVQPEARDEPRGLRPEETELAGEPPERPLD